MPNFSFTCRIIKAEEPKMFTKRDGNESCVCSYLGEEFSESKYPKKLMFSVFDDNVSRFSIHEGEIINGDFDIDAREYNGKHFNNVTCYRLEKVIDNSSRMPEWNQDKSAPWKR